jgi:hypothetical protein
MPVMHGVSRKISLPLDEADETLYLQKERGELSALDICEHLRRTYGILYNPKTIVSRYKRIKEAIMAHLEKDFALNLRKWEPSYV